MDNGTCITGSYVKRFPIPQDYIKYKRMTKDPTPPLIKNAMLFKENSKRKKGDHWDSGEDPVTPKSRKDSPVLTPGRKSEQQSGEGRVPVRSRKGNRTVTTTPQSLMQIMRTLKKTSPQN